MNNEEFISKLQNVLIAISEIWDEPQWESLNEKLWLKQSGYITCTDLNMAQEAFSWAERLINPAEESEHIVDRIERWKTERQN